jgi:formylglycine-generating enzyme required for sulfatase activity
VNKLQQIILLLSLLIFSTCEERERSNPVDPDTELDPSEWAPNNLQAEVIDDSQIKLTWTQEDERISGFRIGRKAGSGSFTQIAQVGKAVTEYTDIGLIFGTSYTYRVSAFTDNNESEYIISTGTNTSFPSPTSLIATPIDDQSIQLTWSDNCSFEVGYRVERSSGGSFTQIAEADADVTEYMNTGLNYGMDYTYRVKAFTAENESDYADTIVNFWQDCLGEWGGTAFENECGCVSGNTGLEENFCYGCTDPTAVNYDIDASVDDGSCLEIEMVALPGGTFTMGDIWNTGLSIWEVPTHQVTLSSFEISATEITNQHYVNYLTYALADGSITATNSSVTGTWEGSSYEFLDLDNSYCQISYSSGQFNVDSGKENYPVIEVSWYGATGFAEHFGFRLPTEAEWEYAARGIASGEDHKWSGTTTEGQLTNYSWYITNNSPSGTKEVATKLPNGNGLYDMSGNVNEWVSDWFGDYSSSPQTDPQGPESGISRVLRGAYWSSNADFCRVAHRGGSAPVVGNYSFGFRLVLSQDL